MTSHESRQLRVAGVLRAMGVDLTRQDLPTLPGTANWLYLAQVLGGRKMGYAFYFDIGGISGGNRLFRDLVAIRNTARKQFAFGDDHKDEYATAIVKIREALAASPQEIRAREDTWLSVLASLAFLKHLGTNGYDLAGAKKFMTVFNKWLEDKTHLLDKAWEFLE